MRIALLCPGPSIARWPGRAGSGADLVLGVNRTALALPWDCDWWCCHDFVVLGEYAALWQRSSQQRWIYASRHAIEMTPAARLIVGCIAATDADVGLREYDYTVLGALRLALLLHRRLGLDDPLAIDAYGCDLAGSTYGVPSPSQPRPTDWPRVRAGIEAILADHPHCTWRHG